jgi:hypothetical protein
MMAEKTRNEGEGSRTAAKQYNEATRDFVESGKVEDSARDAKQAVEGAERDALQEAEKRGREKAKEADPNVPRDYDKPA